MNPRPGTPNPLNGGTLQAQIGIFLRELAHTINAIPSDHNNSAQSGENTNTVMKNCKKRINAAHLR
jgi:hypothetical protein